MDRCYTRLSIVRIAQTMRGTFIRFCLAVVAWTFVAVAAGPSIALAGLSTAARPDHSAASDGVVSAPKDTRPSNTSSSEPRPFGSSLFLGNFSKTDEDGLNPGYVVMQGDRVAVSAWGVTEFSGVYTVDGQGNIFLPEVGPIAIAGVKNADLTEAVRKSMQRVYRKNFDVYTNLLSAKPVAVFVTGAVNRPGRYAGIPSDSVLTFLDQAGGIDPERGSYRHITIRRRGEIVADVDLYDFIIDGRLPNPQLEENDTILVERRGTTVELRGDIVEATMIEFLSDVGSGADALAVVPADALATEVTLVGIREGMPHNATFALVDFAKAQLRHGDVVTLRSDYRAETILVHVDGEFDGPSVFSVMRGARLVDVLHRIRVDPELAHSSAIHIRRKSVAHAQKDAIDDSLFRLERSALLALSSSGGVSEIRVKEAELTRKFVERARLIDPLGRVVTARDGRQLNMILESGDTIVIPSRTEVVRVGGEVLMAQAVVLHPDKDARDYIRRAGGYSQRGDHRKVIILHADASVELGDKHTKIRAGDEILVPPRVDRKIMQGMIDISAVVYQLAVASGVLVRVLATP